MDLSDDTKPGVSSPALRMLRAEPHQVDLTLRLEPHTKGCAWGFAEYLFRADSVEWDGPARVCWMGQWHESPFVSLEQSTRGKARLAEVSCPTRTCLVQLEETRSGKPIHRFWLLGDPVCFVVENPTDEPIDVCLRVVGKAAV